ncbi:MAG: SRPBCC family protein, partial [Chloroflexota bacterium]
MPTVIDHAIAIPTRPHYVWDVIRDIPQNPTWQPNSQRVQFLTSVKQGRGTRWRNTTPDNREQVFEITAWYEGLGYEYRIVDGSPYPKNRGRIRLQEAPEGTVVQWTFSYEVDGFFGSIRNSIGMRGNADKQVVEGLRQLYGYIKDARNDEAYDPEASKAFLREAPNVVERSEYKPRYPSKISDQEIERADVAATQEQDALFRPPTPAIQTQTTPTPIIHEPPVEEGDTRPNPAVSPAAQIDAPPVQATPTTPFERLRQSRQTNLPPLEEPDFLKAIPDALPMDPIPADESAS